MPLKVLQLVRTITVASEEVTDNNEAASAPTAQQKHGRPTGIKWEDFDPHFSEAKTTRNRAASIVQRMCGKSEVKLTQQVLFCEGAPQERKDW